MSLAPGLATEWKLVSDTVWEFTLREGVTWSDGQPLTPEDVVFSLTRSANIPNSPWATRHSPATSPASRWRGRARSASPPSNPRRSCRRT
ncbi:ABC transporter substrate-binding protein [Pseudoroseomonas wenyumeiae]